MRSPAEPPAPLSARSEELPGSFYTHAPVLLNAAEAAAVLERSYAPLQQEASRTRRVDVATLVDVDGAVRAAVVVRSSGESAIDRAAQRSAQSMRFTPARAYDQPVVHTVVVPFELGARARLLRTSWPDPGLTPREWERRLNARTAAAMSELGRISGVVRDGNGVPIGGASVEVTGAAGLRRGAVTPPSGRFILINVPPGDHILTAHAPGFRKAEQPVRVVRGQSTSVDFELRVAPGSAGTDRGEPPRPPAPPAADAPPAPGDAAPDAPPPPPPPPAPDTPRIASEMSERPVFTPYTTPPRLRNADDVAGFLAQRGEQHARDELFRTVVWMLIDRTGAVHRVAVARSSGAEELDAIALEAAGRMQFTPALNRRTPVDVWIQLPVEFRPTR